MAFITSPLRYPGGKSSLSAFLSSLLKANNIENGTYVEPYAGGAGAAINLLLGGYVRRIIINDFDRAIFSFWNAILTEPDNFLRLVAETPVTIDEWRRQKNVFLYPEHFSELAVGFATFFLNRCNRSGIIKANPIGGKNQKGKWRLYDRYNKKDLLARIKRIVELRDRIEIHNLDAINLLEGKVTEISRHEKVLVYLDPPYYIKGNQLYLNYYSHKDHAMLADFLRNVHHFVWAVTYDDVKAIRQLYSWANIMDFSLNYFSYRYKKGCELLIAPHAIALPNKINARYGLI